MWTILIKRKFGVVTLAWYRGSIRGVSGLFPVGEEHQLDASRIQSPFTKRENLRESPFEEGGFRVILRKSPFEKGGFRGIMNSQI
jgi:hypothetical protein